MPRISEQVIDLARSMFFEEAEFVEDMLRGAIAALHTTPEEFARLYVLEEYPIEFTGMDFSDLGESNYLLQIRRQYKIRRKTPEEMAEDISRSLTQGEN